MINIEFDYNKEITIIQAKTKDKFKDVINKYIQKSFLDLNFLSFLTNDKEINPENEVEKIMNEKNKEYKYLRVIVQVIDKSKEIICPECQESCKLRINNFKLELFDCKNKHVHNNINIKDFPLTQKINNSKIVCAECKVRNKGNSPCDEFYTCIDCAPKIICSLCKPKHEPKHKIINYIQKDYICTKHYKPFIKYCTHCNKNICTLCEGEHTGHENIEDIEERMKEEKKKLFQRKEEIESFNTNIKYIIQKLKEIKDIMNIYCEIINNLIYETTNQNYRVLQNIRAINADNGIYEALNVINQIKDIEDKFTPIFNFYNAISDEIMGNTPLSNGLNKTTINYKIVEGDTEIKLFGKNFVENNKSNCHLLIDGEPNKLCVYYKLSDDKKTKQNIEIKLIETKPITNIANIFDGCNSLQSITDWNGSNIEDMSYMFCNCYKLKSLPDISNLETNKVKNMNNIFRGCSSLKSLPDISRWNTENVMDMSSMFLDCSSLETLPNISNWNINKVENMSYMFAGCSSLNSFPKIDNWLNNDKIKQDEMFKDCKEGIIPKKTNK